MSERRRPFRLLLVEDDPDHVELVRHALTGDPRIGELAHVGDGAEALRYLRAEDEHGDRVLPDVVLLDLDLPQKDGLEVLREIKRDECLRTLPVIVLTTSESGADIAAAYHDHANSYLVKPVDYGSFQELMNRLSGYWGVVNRGPRDGEAC